MRLFFCCGCTRSRAGAIRRWAAAILGGSGMPEAIEPLCKVLSDASAIVRRTAGDALSDLGDARASGTMCQALEDRSKCGGEPPVPQ